MQQKSVKINNMSCQHCVRTIESELSDMEGVQSAQAELGTKTVTISWDRPATWDKIKDVLVEINYPPSD